MAYGSRATAPLSGAGEKQPSRIEKVLDYLADIRVPHNYFTHFYVLSVLCSLLSGWTMGIGVRDFTSIGQVPLPWLLMLLQGTRRMIESYTYTSTSKSRMWFGHWILGLLFYLTINIAIWIEGTSTSNDREISWKLAVLVPAILSCHILQHSYHAYLYRLRTTNSTYQLPSHPSFPNLLCPHYTCETLIYLLLAFISAPTGKFVNWTVLSATVFVAVNLGVTANGTKEFYEQRFGPEKVRDRKRMVPNVW